MLTRSNVLLQRSEQQHTAEHSRLRAESGAARGAAAEAAAARESEVQLQLQHAQARLQTAHEVWKKNLHVCVCSLEAAHVQAYKF